MTCQINTIDAPYDDEDVLIRPNLLHICRVECNLVYRLPMGTCTFWIPHFIRRLATSTVTLASGFTEGTLFLLWGRLFCRMATVVTSLRLSSLCV